MLKPPELRRGTSVPVESLASPAKAGVVSKSFKKKKKKSKADDPHPSVAVAKITVMWAEDLRQGREHLPSTGDAALGYDPPPGMAPPKRDEGEEEGEEEEASGGGADADEEDTSSTLKPYVTIEVLGGECSGACSSQLSVLHGSHFTSDWAECGLAPAWHQDCEAATTDPHVAFVRFAVWHRKPPNGADLLAVAVVPWWCLREGVRVVPLDDSYGRSLARAKLVVRLQMRGSRLTDEQARRRANADLRPPRQIGTLVTNGIDVSSLVTSGDEVGVIGFKKKSVRVAEDEGTVRLTVKRKSGGDAPCVVFFSTSDGTARAGTDYIPQTGHLFFLRGQKTKEIKVLVIDDDEASGLKTFFVTLSHPENCMVKSAKDKVKVTITDDDNLDMYRSIKQSITYTLIESILILYALFGNETVLYILVNICNDRELLGNTPLSPTGMDDAVGTATLVLFFFFLTDMILQFCIQGWDYVTGSTIRFVLDLLATILLLPSSIFIDDVIRDLCILIAGGDVNVGQTIVDNIQQGTVARLSRVARLASRLTRTIKHVSSASRWIIGIVVRKQGRGGVWMVLAKLCGVVDEAAKELEAAEKAREEQRERTMDLEREVETARRKSLTPPSSFAMSPGGDGDGSAADGDKSGASTDPLKRRSSGGIREAVRTRASKAFAKSPVSEATRLKQRKDRALARAALKANETSPSAIGATVLEKMTSKLVLTILLLLLVYSTFYDLPQIQLRQELYQQQLTSLVLIAERTGATDSAAFLAARDALVGNGSALTPDYLDSLRFQEGFHTSAHVLYIKVAGTTVFNLSAALNLSYSIIEWRRPTELLYTRDNCGADYLGQEVANDNCESVVVFDRRLELRGGLRDQMLVTVLMVVIVASTICMMAVDMQQMLLNPIDRIAKLIKTISGRHWRKKKKKEGADASLPPSFDKIFEAFELETYFGLKTINFFLIDLEQAFGVAMGRQRQSLWALEHWFDKLFLLINRTMEDAEKPDTTVEDLASRFTTFWRSEMRALNRKVEKNFTQKKPVAKALLFVNMLHEPIEWVLGSIKAALISQMRLVLGDTDTIRANKLTIVDIRTYAELKLSSIEQRAQEDISQTKFDGENSDHEDAQAEEETPNSPPPQHSSPRSLISLIRRARLVTASLYLAKLASYGIHIVGEADEATDDVAAQPTAKSVRRTIVDSLVHATRLRGLLEADALKQITSIFKWTQAVRPALIAEYRDILYRHELIEHEQWRPAVQLPSQRKSLSGRDLATISLAPPEGAVSLAELHASADADGLCNATDVLPTELQLEWLKKLPEAVRARLKANSGEVTTRRAPAELAWSSEEVQSVLEVLHQTLSTALGLRMEAEEKDESEDQQGPSTARMRRLLEQWSYPAAFTPAMASSAQLGAADPARLALEMSQEYSFLRRLGVSPPQLYARSAAPDAQWVHAVQEWGADARGSVAPIVATPAASGVHDDVDVEAAEAASTTPVPASPLRGLPSRAALLLAPASERARIVAALSEGSALHALRRRYLRFALVLASELPPTLESSEMSAQALNQLKATLTLVEVTLSELQSELSKAQLSVAATSAAIRRSGSPVSSRLSSGGELLSARYAKTLTTLKAATETAAINCLFSGQLEVCLKAMEEYETLRSPVMSLLRFCAHEQLRALEAAGQRSTAMWNADPPIHPREILVGVMREFGTPGMLSRFLGTFEQIEAWWGANSYARLPRPIPGRPAGPSG